MPTAYVSFCKPVNFDTAAGLIRACRETLYDWQDKEKTKRANWDRIRLMMSSGGGSIIPAFAAYNELRAMPTEIHTINTGATDSAALIVFMTGKRRYACAHSAFLFHQMTWTFSTKDDVPVSIVSEAARWMTMYQGMMADAIAEDSKITRDECLAMMQTGTTLTAQEALERGLVHEIAEPTIPADARWWQV